MIRSSWPGWYFNGSRRPDGGGPTCTSPGVWCPRNVMFLLLLLGSVGSRYQIMQLILHALKSEKYAWLNSGYVPIAFIPVLVTYLLLQYFGTAIFSERCLSRTSQILSCNVRTTLGSGVRRRTDLSLMCGHTLLRWHSCATIPQLPYP